MGPKVIFILDIAPCWSEVEGLHEWELRDGGDQVDGVEDGHGDEDLVEDGQHWWSGQHVYTYLKDIIKSL